MRTRRRRASDTACAIAHRTVSQTDKRGFRTKREAEMFAAEVEVYKARGEYVAPSLGRVTVGELTSLTGSGPVITPAPG